MDYRATSADSTLPRGNVASHDNFDMTSGNYLPLVQNREVWRKRCLKQFQDPFRDTAFSSWSTCGQTSLSMSRTCELE